MVTGGKPYITDQTENPVGQKFLGSSSVRHGGCGAVATYNALVDLGVSVSFNDVLAYYNEDPMSRLTLNGWLGILPTAVAQYFVDHGYQVIMTDAPDAIDLYSRTADASIMYYMFVNNSGIDSVGAHFVSYRRINNGYVGMNTSENGGIYHFTHPSDYGYKQSRFYAIGIFIYT